jgi:hypothetical protein
MPLIEPVARCRKFAKLSRAGGWFYLQLKTILDPLGRHDADAQILASALFPLRKDARTTDITRWLAECRHAGLLRLFVDTRSRLVVEVYDAVQHRMSSRKSQHELPAQAGLPLLDETDPAKVVLKKPPPGGKPVGGAPTAAREARALPGKGNEEKGSNNAHTAHAGEATSVPLDSKKLATLDVPGSAAQEFAEAAIPTWDEVKTAANMSGVSEASARAFYDHHEDNTLWLNQYQRLINWRRKLVSWATKDRQNPPKKNEDKRPEKNQMSESVNVKTL